MPGTKPTSPAQFRARMIERVSAGRTLASMATESGTSEMSARGWDRQDDLETGRRTDGLPTEETQELVRLREDNARLRVERHPETGRGGLAHEVVRTTRHEINSRQASTRSSRGVLRTAIMSNLL